MAIVTTDNKHYKDIAEAIRDVGIIHPKLRPGSMASTLKFVVSKSNEEAYDRGEIKGYERGDAEGFERGNSMGYANGFDEGRQQGLTEGKAEVYSEIEPINAQLENTLYGEDINTEGTVIDALGQNVNQANSDFVAIKGKIVEKGVEVADGMRTAEYASKVDEVYEKGKQAQYDELWDNNQEFGNREKYARGYMGWGWTFANFYPKYDIRPIGDTIQMFYAWQTASRHKGSLIDRLNECGVVLNTSQATNLTSAFAYSHFTELPTIDCTGLTSASTGVFEYGFALYKIEKIISKEGVTFTNWFRNSNIAEVRFEGVISEPINLQWSTRLSKASIASIFNALSLNTSGLSITLSLAAVKSAFETSAGANNGLSSMEWNTMYATRSNWTINLV